MYSRLSVKTDSQTEFIDITQKIQNIISEREMDTGICHIFVPHTTAGVSINENADPSVVHDILKELNKIVPFQDSYQHGEGNSAAHIKSSLIGSSLSVIIENGRLQLGTWQGIYFCEFDGPRVRNVWVKLMADK
ncbi:MAG: secondary thiamine-phosphate synthase enzyme YjbQ [Calditrichia bacterium]